MEKIKNGQNRQEIIHNETSEFVHNLYTLNNSIFQPNTISTATLKTLKPFLDCLKSSESQVQDYVLKSGWKFFTKSLDNNTPESVKFFLNRYFSQFKKHSIAAVEVNKVTDEENDSNIFNAIFKVGDNYFNYPIETFKRSTGDIAIKIPSPPTSVSAWKKLVKDNQKHYPNWSNFYTFTKQEENFDNQEPRGEVTVSNKDTNKTDVDSISNHDRKVYSKPTVETQTFYLQIATEQDFQQRQQHALVEQKQQELENLIAYLEEYNPQSCKYNLTFGFQNVSKLTNTLDDLQSCLQESNIQTLNKKKLFELLYYKIKDLRAQLAGYSPQNDSAHKHLILPYLELLNQVHSNLLLNQPELAINIIKTQVLSKFKPNYQTELITQIKQEVADIKHQLQSEFNLRQPNTIEINYGGLESPQNIDYYAHSLLSMVTKYSQKENLFSEIKEILQSIQDKYFHLPEIQSALPQINLKSLNSDLIFPQSSKISYDNQSLEEVLDSQLFSENHINSVEDLREAVDDLREAIILLRENGGDGSSKYIKLSTIIRHVLKVASDKKLVFDPEDTKKLSDLLNKLENFLSYLNLLEGVLYFLTLDHNAENGFKMKSLVLLSPYLDQSNPKNKNILEYVDNYTQLQADLRITEQNTGNDQNSISGIQQELSSIKEKIEQSLISKFNIVFKLKYSEFIRQKNPKFIYDSTIQRQYANDLEFWDQILGQLYHQDLLKIAAIFKILTTGKVNLGVQDEANQAKVLTIDKQVDLSSHFNKPSSRRTFTIDEENVKRNIVSCRPHSTLRNGHLVFSPIKITPESIDKDKPAKQPHSQATRDKQINDNSDYNYGSLSTNLPFANFDYSNPLILDPNWHELSKAEKAKTLNSYIESLVKEVSESNDENKIKTINYKIPYNKPESNIKSAPQRLWTKKIELSSDLVNDQEEGITLGTDVAIQTQEPTYTNKPETDNQTQELSPEAQVTHFWARLNRVNDFQESRHKLYDYCLNYLKPLEENPNQLAKGEEIISYAKEIAQKYNVEHPILQLDTADKESIGQLRVILKNPREDFSGFLNQAEIDIFASRNNPFYIVNPDPNFYAFPDKQNAKLLEHSYEDLIKTFKKVITVLKNPSQSQLLVPLVKDYKSVIIQMNKKITPKFSSSEIKQILSCNWQKGFKPNTHQIKLVALCLVQVVCKGNQMSIINELLQIDLMKGKITGSELTNQIVCNAYFGVEGDILEGDKLLKATETLSKMLKDLKQQDLQLKYDSYDQNENLEKYLKHISSLFKDKYITDELIQNVLAGIEPKTLIDNISNRDRFSGREIEKFAYLIVIKQKFVLLLRQLSLILPPDAVQLLRFKLAKDTSKEQNEYSDLFVEKYLLNPALLDQLTSPKHKSIAKAVASFLNTPSPSYNLNNLKDLVETNNDMVDLLKIGQILFLLMTLDLEDVFHYLTHQINEDSLPRRSVDIISKLDNNKLNATFQDSFDEVAKLINELNQQSTEQDYNTIDCQMGRKMRAEIANTLDLENLTNTRYVVTSTLGELNDITKSAYQNLLNNLQGSDKITTLRILRQIFTFSNQTPILKQMPDIVSNQTSDTQVYTFKELFQILCVQNSDMEKLANFADSERLGKDFKNLIVKSAQSSIIYDELNLIQKRVSELSRTTSAFIQPSSKRRKDFAINYLNKATDQTNIFTPSNDIEERFINFCTYLFSYKFQLITKQQPEFKIESALEYLLDLNPQDSQQKIIEYFGPEYNNKLQNWMPQTTTGKNLSLKYVQALVKMLPSSDNDNWLNYWSPQVKQNLTDIRDLKSLDNQAELSTVDFGDVIFYNPDRIENKTISDTQTEVRQEVSIDYTDEQEEVISEEKLADIFEDVLLDAVSEEELLSTDSANELIIDSLITRIECLVSGNSQKYESPQSLNIWEITNAHTILARFSEICVKDYGFPGLYDLDELYQTNCRSFSFNDQEFDTTQITKIKSILINTLQKVKVENQILDLEAKSNQIPNEHQDYDTFANSINNLLDQRQKNLSIKFELSPESDTDPNLSKMTCKKINVIVNQYLISNEDNFEKFLIQANQENSMSCILPIGLRLKNLAPENSTYYNFALPNSLEHQNIYRGRINRGQRIRFGLIPDGAGKLQMLIYYLGNDH
ncbi:MAG: hypothetical protein AAGF07_04200 [Patescibacteria group bacterium]